MEKNRVRRYVPSSGDASNYYHETSAVNDLIEFNSSAVIGNLADVMRRGPVRFPNILAPDAFRNWPLGKMEIAEKVEVDKR